MAEPYDLRKWVLKALDDGATGLAGDIRTHTPGASKVPVAEIEAALLQLEDEGLAEYAGGAWRSATVTGSPAGSSVQHGTQRRALVYMPSYDPSTYLHLSYWEGPGNYRLRRYTSGGPVEAFVVESADNVDTLRVMHPFADERDWSPSDARSVEHVEFWAAEIQKLNRLLPVLQGQ